MEHGTVDLTGPDVTARVRAIRSRLPGQTLKERLETALLSYGRLYPLEEVRRRVADTLPRRIGYVRGAAIEAIEAYTEPIPDEVLLKYDDAARSGLFSKFLAVTPRYYDQSQTDPWIVGQVTGSDLFALIARWDA